ncbi:hypothetical protein CFP56_041255 [Quercus suber]|uniref:Uncharacterized protein n=1 Tax=Quercus suber TaxID=58331 RepID=A0AAW0LKM1_QUESU
MALGFYGWVGIPIRTVTGSEEANPKCQEFRKKGLDHYELLGQLFNTSIVTRFLQSSSAQPALNSDKEQELDERFLSAGVYVHLEADSGDDIEELATLVEQQSKCVENHIAQPKHSKGKKKGKTLGKMTEAIKRFTEVSKARLIANESRKQTGLGIVMRSLKQCGQIIEPNMVEHRKQSSRSTL